MTVDFAAATDRVAVIGGGPAGLIAAEVIASQGIGVDVYDAMPSPGRKFLLAGIGGMNITHAEPLPDFVSRYGERQQWMSPLLADFPPDVLRDWIHGLGIETFVGSSGRVFPTAMKAAPLLRAWLSRLRQQGVRVQVRHHWQGWDEQGNLRFATLQGELRLKPAATVLALGGGSWSRLGSDGAWVPVLAGRGISVAPLRPANCGFDLQWSAAFANRYAGTPLKTVTLRFHDNHGNELARRGDLMITQTGLEGGLVYALSAGLRDRILDDGGVEVRLDLVPDRSEAELQSLLARPRGSRSLASHMERAGIRGVRANLLREILPAASLHDPHLVAATAKALPLRLLSTRPMDEVISTAGGVTREALDEQLMLQALPGVFCAGEMLDWEAPTGGYLLSACFASGVRAGRGVCQFLGKPAAAGLYQYSPNSVDP